MGIAAIITGVASVEGLAATVAKCEAEKEELETLKSSLTEFDPSIEYVLQNHSHIKWTYFLAGTKYAKETKEEEDTLKDIEKSFSGHIDSAVEAVEAKIKSLDTQISSLKASIKVLEASKKKK